MRPLAMPRIGLKRALPLHVTLPKKIEPAMLANGFEECQSEGWNCATVGVLFSLSARDLSMQVWSLTKDFHTCGKNCGKSHARMGWALARAEILGFLPGAKLRTLIKSALQRLGSSCSPEKCGSIDGESPVGAVFGVTK